MAHVYRHIRLDKNEPFYIGIGADNLGRRAHDKKARRSKWWNSIVEKHGYIVQILFEDVSIEFAKEKEKAFFEGHKDLLEYDKLTLKLTNPTDNETLELYQSHTIFLAPSFLEYGHPNLSILEAMSCGLPIVGTSNVKLPGMYNLVENTTQAVVTGIQFTCGNYPKARQEQLDNRINHDWLVVCRERLQKMYHAISIIGQKWTSEDTKQAYINTYAGI
jgi:glycosyltransferase involved in cell wall biosynthesis